MSETIVGVVVGFLLGFFADQINEYLQSLRLRTDLTDQIVALSQALSKAVKQKNWQSQTVKAHLERIIELCRSSSGLRLFRTGDKRRVLLDYYASLVRFAESWDTFGPPHAVPLPFQLDLAEKQVTMPSIPRESLVSRLQQYQSFFDNLVDAAKKGNIQARKSLLPVARNLLELGTEMFGSSGGYFELAKKTEEAVVEVQQTIPPLEFEELSERTRSVLALLGLAHFGGRKS